MAAPRNILGISAYYHDAAAALVIDGKIISAAQEERFTRKKTIRTFPGKRRNSVSNSVSVTQICRRPSLTPHWFRGWYRFSLRLGFYSGQFIGRCLLILFFIFIMTPLGFILRLSGKDSLQLKRPRDPATYRSQAKDSSPLDRLF